MSFFFRGCTHDLVNLGKVPCEMVNSILMHKLLNTFMYNTRTTSSATQMIDLKVVGSGKSPQNNEQLYSCSIESKRCMLW